MDKERIVKNCDYLIIAGLYIYSFSAIPSTTGISIGVIIALISWIARMFITKRLELKNHYLNLPILIFFGILILSSLNSSVSIIQSFDRVRSLGAKMILYYLIINGIKEEKELKYILIILFLSAFIYSLYKLIEYTFFFTPEKYISLTKNRALGASLGMLFPVLISISFFSSISKNYKYFIFFSILIILGALQLTSTRGAILGIIFGLIFLGIFLNRKVFIYLFIIAIVLIFVLPKSHIKRLINYKNSSNIHRIYLYGSSLLMIKEKPILGHGLDSFRFLYPNYMEKLSKKARIRFCAGSLQRHSHNIFLNIGAEAGIFACLILIYLIYRGFRMGWFIVKNIEENEFRILVIGILASLIDFLVHSQVDYTLAGKTGFLFWFYLGILSWIEEKKLRQFS